MNATSTFATPPIARSGFSTPHGAATGRLEPRRPCRDWTTTERAALFGAFRLLRRNGSGRKVKTPFGRQSGAGNPTLGQHIPPVPDIALPSQSTGAKP